jgi:integrase
MHSGKGLLRVTLADLRAFLDRLDDPGSRSAERSQLRSFYQWATLENYLTEDPTYRLEPIRKRKYLPRPIPDDLLARALTDPPERVKPMLWLAAYAGLRACDICQLRVEHLMFDRDPPVIFVEESKGGKPRTVPMAPILASELRGRFDGYGWAFPYHDGRAGHIPAQYVSKLCNDYLHSLGITETLHQLRHWAVSEWYRSSERDLVVTQALAGHENISTTRLYTWTDPGAPAEAVAAMRSVLAPQLRAVV